MTKIHLGSGADIVGTLDDPNDPDLELAEILQLVKIFFCFVKKNKTD